MSLNQSAIMAEQSVIGSILFEPNVLREFRGRINVDDFQLESDRRIMSSILSLYDRGAAVDVVTVLGEMRSAGTYDEQTRDYILQIGDVTPTAANVEAYISMVRDNSIRAKVQTTLAGLMADDTSSGEELLANAHDAISALSEHSARSDLVTMAEMQVNFFKALEDRQRGIRNAVQTGYTHLDKQLSGGLLNRGFYILAGRPGMGKTSLALNIATRAKGSVLYITLEMDEEQLTPRLYANLTGISSDRLLTARDLTGEEFGKIAEASTKIKQDFYINALPTMDVPKIGALARSVRNLSLVVIDYMGLIDSEDKNRYSRTSDISAGLKLLARRLGVPILCLCQLNRAVETRLDKRPIMADLRDSGGIEQDADGIIFVYRPDYYQPKQGKRNPWDVSFVDIIVAKNRHGDTGSVGFNACLANNNFWEC